MLCDAKCTAAEDKGQMMETKGRRAPRAARPIESPAEPVNPVEVPALAEQPAEAPTEPLEAAEILDEVTKPVETAIDFVAPTVTPASQPGVAALTKVAGSPYFLHPNTNASCPRARIGIALRLAGQSQSGRLLTPLRSSATCVNNQHH